METGTEVTTSYDPMLAKVIAYGRDRAHALERLDEALARTRVDGIETNLGLVRAALADPSLRRATHSTATLAHVTDPTRRVEVVSGGTLTTVQDWPGRTGHWQVGVPPCGPMDDLSFRLGNRALGNHEGHPVWSAPSRGRPCASPMPRRCASPAHRRTSPWTARRSRSGNR